MTRLPEGVRSRTTGTLIERTEKIVKQYDMEDKDYAFGDSGDAATYADEMADLLEQWAKAQRASLAMHPANQESDEIITPELPSIHEWARRLRQRRNES